MTTQPFEVHVSDNRHFTFATPVPVLDFDHVEGDYLWVATSDEGELVMVEPDNVYVCQGPTCTVPDCIVRKDFEEDAPAVGEDLSYREGYLELQRTLASNNLVLNDIYDKLHAACPDLTPPDWTLGQCLAAVLQRLATYEQSAPRQQESHHGPPSGFSTNPASNPRQG